MVITTVRSYLQVKDKCYFSFFSQILVAVVHDLGLHKPPLRNANHHQSCGTVSQDISGARTDEERRAVLGVFLHTSMYSCGTFPCFLFLAIL
jgi:hypothetical protein